MYGTYHIKMYRRFPSFIHYLSHSMENSARLR